MTESYFFDTYAIIEILNKNPSYAPFTKVNIVTGKLNVFELFYKLIKTDQKIAKKILDRYYSTSVEFDKVIIQSAARLKAQNRQLSIADCIGYMLACKHNIPFLTGDKAFEHMDNVLFVR